MSGGTWEYMMGVYSNATNNNGYPGYSGYGASSNYNSGYNGWLSGDGVVKTNGKAWPTSKYYELFTSTTASTACSGGICYGHSLSETASWYGASAVMITATNTWFFRGGSFSHGANGGVFLFNANNGYASSDISFRLVISNDGL